MGCVTVPELPAESRGNARTSDSPRTQQTEECIFFQIEPDIARVHNPQLAGPEIFDRASVEILLDNGRAHV